MPWRMMTIGRNIEALSRMAVPRLYPYFSGIRTEFFDLDQ